MDAMTHDLVVRQLRPEPPGTSISRVISVLVATRGNMLDAKEYSAAPQFRTTPMVHAVFRLAEEERNLATKAAVAPGTVGDSAWAGALVNAGVAAEAVSLMAKLSIVGAVAPRCVRAPFGVRIPRDISGAALGAFVPEGAPLPGASLAFNSLGPLAPDKIGAVIAITSELALAGTPGADAMIRTALLAGLSRKLDLVFLDPANAGAPGVPASITNGAGVHTSTGSSAAQISADLAALNALVTTSGGQRVWIMPQKTFGTISGALQLQQTGAQPLLWSYPVIVSDSSPPQVVLADCGGIIVSDEGGFDVDLSREATPQLDTAPPHPATAAQVLTPLWSLNQIGIRAVRVINWLRPLPNSVAYMVTAY
jgi:HK97 family phage major capsid protein